MAPGKRAKQIEFIGTEAKVSFDDLEMNRRERILLLDPDATILIELQQLLEDAGFDTSTTWE